MQELECGEEDERKVQDIERMKQNAGNGVSRRKDDPACAKSKARSKMQVIEMHEEKSETKENDENVKGRRRKKERRATREGLILAGSGLSIYSRGEEQSHIH